MLTFVKLTTKKTSDGHRIGVFRCGCGACAIRTVSRVKSGYVKWCDACAVKAMVAAKLKHGMKGTAEYRTWVGMITRCHNPKSKDYARYGGSGIFVCTKWRKSFVAFFKYVGPRPRGTSIDRINGKRGYEPGNVRWATMDQQIKNRRKPRGNHSSM